MLWRIVTLAVFAASATSSAQAAGGRVTDQNLNSWWDYSGDHPLKGPWGVFTEVRIRREKFVDVWQQLVFREAATYRFSDRVQVASGYVWTRNARYGDYPVAHAFLEHRVYEQLSVRHELKRLDVEYRFRVEQRWFQNFTEGEAYYWRYQDRARYQIKLAFPISKTDSRGRQWSLFAGDEVMLHFGPNHGPNTLNQNRATAGVGYKLSRNNKIEIGYLNQFLLQQNGQIAESNHVLHVQFSSTARLFKKL